MASHELAHAFLRLAEAQNDLTSIMPLRSFYINGIISQSCPGVIQGVYQHHTARSRTTTLKNGQYRKTIKINVEHKRVLAQLPEDGEDTNTAKEQQ